jgi:uncharacterized membrane protein YidH (DUF202 family)
VKRGSKTRTWNRRSWRRAPRRGTTRPEVESPSIEINEKATQTETVDATRLAGERTELAWWRTGLTALAVALAVGRVIPGLDHSSTDWLYDVAGICFALYGVAVIGYGSLRREAIDRALAEGHFPDPAATRAHLPGT